MGARRDLRISRSRFLVWAGLGVLIALLSARELLAEDRPRLVVYLHTTIRARALESALQHELPAVDVLVVSRHRDFARELAQRPDAALALQPVLRDQGWNSELSGTRSGEDTEPYVLLSIGAGVDAAQAARLVLGAVDLMGRERTGPFVAGLLDSSVIPSIKYVIKTEDLLPLLQFRSVDAVVLSDHEANRIKRISKLDLRITPLSKRVGLAAVVFTTPRGRTVIKPGLQALTPDTLSKLGVEGWR
jgi:hypothetical protein